MSSSFFVNHLDDSPAVDDDDFAHDAAFTALHKRREEYTSFADISVLVGTFNVNGQYPTQDLTPWLCPEINGNVIDPPDIYAIGFQELDLSQQAYLYDFIITSETSNDRQDKWLSAVTKALHPAARYTKIRAIRLVGILIVVFVKTSLESVVSQVQFSVVPTGIMNRMGNKGGCAIRAKIRDSSFCFVTSHLAAHFTEYLKRNLDFHAIRNGMRFGAYNEAGMLDHDVIFWFGDLNYRLQVGTTPPSQPDIRTVKDMISANQLTELRLLDQLHLAQKAGAAFDEFIEGGPGHPTFKPTYKYDVASDNFDSSEKNRVPAWTDRILVGGKDKSFCRLAVYDSTPEIKLSDHKPVYAIYTVKVRVEDPAKRQRILNEEFKNIDKQRNDYQPRVALSVSEVDFGDVGYGDNVCRHVKIENVGKVRARLMFEPPRTPDDHEPRKLPEWLRICPSMTRLDPGSSINIEFCCDMDSCRSVYDINDPTKTSICDSNLPLDCYVILMVDKGSHIFVSVKASYDYSCFGRPLSDLPTVNELKSKPGEEPSVPLLIDLGDGGETRSELPSFLANVPGDVPVAIARLVHHVRSFGIRHSKLINNAPLASEYAQLRETLTSNKLPFAEKLPFNIHTIALALPTFLASLREPLVPYDLYDTVAKLTLTQKASLSIVVNDRFPVQHLSILRYLVDFFKDLLRHEAENGVSLDLLCMTFGPALLRRALSRRKTPPPRPPPPQTRKANSKFFSDVGRQMSERETEVKQAQDEDHRLGSEFVKFLLIDWVYLPD